MGNQPGQLGEHADAGKLKMIIINKGVATVQRGEVVRRDDVGLNY